MTSTVHYKDIVKTMKKDVEGFFEKYDTNGDKKITRIEMIEALRKGGKKNPEKIATFLFKDDVNKDSQLSIDEVKRRVGRMQDENINNVLEWDVNRFLELNDKNKDMKISRHELIERFASEGAVDPEFIADAIFRQMDLNKDGTISPDEIREYNRKKKFSFLDSSAPNQ